MSKFKFGRTAPDPFFKHKLIKLGDFLRPKKLVLPPGIWRQDWAAPAIAGLENILDNDKYGCCFPAACLHANDVMVANAQGSKKFATDDQLVWLYQQVCPGSDPATDANDNGTDDQTMFNQWVNKGLFADGSGKAEVVASVDATEPSQLAAAQYLFGNTISACSLPDTVTNNMPSASGFVWSDTSAPGDPANGHAMYQYGINKQGLFDNTWGMFGTLTFDWLAKYCAGNNGALYVVLGFNWKVTGQQKSPNGVAWDDLEDAIAAQPAYL